MNGWIIALEGGGSRSQAVAVDPQGTIRGSGLAQDVNTNFTPFESARAAVRTAVTEALASAGITGADIHLLVSALVGPRFGAETFADLLPNAYYRYYNEAQVVFARGGIYDPNGIAVVAATGATAWGRRKEPAKTYACGGWGSLLGDEGSGYDLGHSALRAACKAAEGRLGLPTRLPEALSHHFGFPPETFRHQMVVRAYQPPLTRAEIAGIAPVVARLAHEDDPAALAVLARVAADLSALALHAASQLFSPHETFDLVVAGGMTNIGDLYLAPLREGFAQRYPLVTLKIGTEDPAEAVAKLARHDVQTI